MNKGKISGCNGCFCQILAVYYKIILPAGGREADTSNASEKKEERTVHGSGMDPDRRRRLLAGGAFVLFLLLTAVVGWYIGRPMVALAGEPERFRAWVDSHGLWGSLAFLGMMVLQVVIALIPGEPLEIAAGYAFGFWQGTLLCLIGIFLGSVLVFLLVRRFGTALVEVFFSQEKIHSLKFLHQSRRRDFLIFLVLFIPGTPKDLLSYFAGLTDIRLSKWLLIAAVARIPSVATSTAGGAAVGDKNYLFAAVVFAATFVISLLGLWLYNRISARREEKRNHEQ